MREIRTQGVMNGWKNEMMMELNVLFIDELTSFIYGYMASDIW